MKGLNKLLLVSAVLSAALSQMSAYKVVDEDDKMIDVYGSARGYVGFGATMGGSSTTTAGTTTNTSNPSFGSAIYGLQSNSRLGVKAKIGNVNLTTEIGLDEPNNFRQMWGSYTFESAGTLLLGKLDTPSVAKSSFASDVANTDQGHAGFGGLRTSNRKFQLSYSIAGLTVALVDDSGVVDVKASQNEAIPRIATNYFYQNDDKTLEVQVGGSYKYYNAGVRGGQGDANSRFATNSGSAFHIFTAVKSQMMENSLYVSAMAHYGMNADLYGEQRTSMNDGSYKHTDIMKVSNANVSRAGGYVEGGYKINDTLSGVLAAGYQYTWANSNDPKLPAGTTTTMGTAQTFTVMAQLPMKLDKNFRLTPQIGYYGTILGGGDQNTKTVSTNHGVLAFVQLRYDF